MIISSVLLTKLERCSVLTKTMHGTRFTCDLLHAIPVIYYMIDCLCFTLSNISKILYLQFLNCLMILKLLRYIVCSRW